MDHFTSVQNACEQALRVFGLDNLRFRPMARIDNRVNAKRGIIIGRTNLKTGLITIDIFTLKKRQPKKISAILSVLAHEAAHHIKRPYRSRFRGRIITRIHYPIFYRQVKRNIKKLKQDKILGGYFR